MAKQNGGNLDAGVLPVRVALGVVFTYHGYLKLFGGGVVHLAEGLGAMGLQPAMAWAVLVAATEFLGGLGVLVGMWTRLAALGIACVMAVAVFKVHLPHGFSAMDGGYEYPFSLLGAALSLVILGGGRFGLGALFRRGK